MTQDADGPYIEVPCVCGGYEAEHEIVRYLPLPIKGEVGPYIVCHCRADCDCPQYRPVVVAK